MLVAKVYTSLYLYALVYGFSYMVIHGNLGGTYKAWHIELSPLLFAMFFLLNIIILLIPYFIYLITRRVNFFPGGAISYRYKKTSFVVLFILASELIFVSTTGVGRVLSNSEHFLSPAFAALSPSFFMPIYYLLFREKSFLFFTNISLWVAWQIVSGWSSVLLLVCFLELYFILKNINLNYVFNCIIVLFLPIVLLFSGALAYKFIYPLKFEIRGQSVNKDIGYTEGAILLAERLNNFTLSVAGLQRAERVESIYKSYNRPSKELVTVLRPLVPSSFMDKGSIATLNNDILRAYKPDISLKTSSDVGFATYSFVFLKSNVVYFLLYLMISIFLLFCVKMTLDAMSKYRGQLDFIWFICLFSFFYTCTLEQVFSSFIRFGLYFMPFLWLTGCFKFRRVFSN